MHTITLNDFPKVVANTNGRALTGSVYLTAPVDFHAEEQKSPEDQPDQSLSIMGGGPNFATIIVDMDRVIRENDHEDGLELVEASDNLHQMLAGKPRPSARGIDSLICPALGPDQKIPTFEGIFIGSLSGQG